MLTIIILIIVDIVLVGLALGGLLLISFTLRQNKWISFVIPVTLGGLFLIFTVWTISLAGKEQSSNLYSLSFVFFLIPGAISFVAGAIIGALLNYGSRMWMQSRKLLSVILILASFLFSIFCTSGFFYAVAMLATG